MGIELSGTNDIVRRNGNLPDEVLATKAGSSLTASEVAYLESLPPQSKLKQAYEASTAKTELLAYQVPQIQVMVSGGGNGVRAVLIGHSYLDQETATSTYNRPFVNLHGTVAWMNFFMGWPLEIVRSHAIGGERLIDLEDRIDSALSESADLAIWNIGINDLKETKNPGNSRFTGRPYVVDPQQRNLAYCIDKAAGLLKRIAEKYGRVVVFPENSPANGGADQNKQLAARTAQYNRALQRLCASDARMLYVPIDRLTWDPLSVAGDVRTDYYYDAIHPGPLAAFMRGKFAARLVKDFLKALPDRLPSNVFETYTNQRIQGTSLSAQGGGVLRVPCPNVSAGYALIREGDMVGLSVPSAGNTAWNGRWLCTNGTSTYVDLACPVPGSYTGTVNLSASDQVWDNPLFTTTTGGTSGGGGTVTGALPAGVSLSLPTGAAVTVTTPAHTDMDGVADGLGNWLDLQFTLLANQETYLFLLCHRSNTASPYHARVFTGDVIQAGFDVEIVGTPSGVYSSEFGFLAAYTPPSAGQVQLPVMSLSRPFSGMTAVHPNAACRGAVMTAEWRVPADVGGSIDTIDGQVYIKAGASGATVRMRIGRVGVSVLRQPLRSNIDVALDI